MLGRFCLPRQYIQFFSRPIVCSESVLRSLRFYATLDKAPLKEELKIDIKRSEPASADIPDGLDSLPDLTKVEDSLVFRDLTLGEILRYKDTEVQRQNRQLSGTRPTFPVYHISPGDLVFDAIKLMSEKRIGALLVRAKSREDDDARGLDQYVGIFTERDYMNKVALKGLNSRTTRVEEIMTKSPVIATSHERCLTALQKMTNGRFRHIPVVENNRIVGLLSIGDLVKSLVTNFRESVEYMNDYVGGKIK